MSVSMEMSAWGRGGDCCRSGRGVECSDRRVTPLRAACVVACDVIISGVASDEIVTSSSTFTSILIVDSSMNSVRNTLSRVAFSNERDVTLARSSSLLLAGASLKSVLDVCLRMGWRVTGLGADWVGCLGDDGGGVALLDVVGEWVASVALGGGGVVCLSWVWGGVDCLGAGGGGGAREGRSILLRRSRSLPRTVTSFGIKNLKHKNVRHE